MQRALYDLILGNSLSLSSECTVTDDWSLWDCKGILKFELDLESFFAIDLGLS